MFVSGSSFCNHDGISNSASLGSKKHRNPERQNIDSMYRPTLVLWGSCPGKGVAGLQYSKGRLVIMTQCKTCKDS